MTNTASFPRRAIGRYPRLDARSNELIASADGFGLSIRSQPQPVSPVVGDANVRDVTIALSSHVDRLKGHISDAVDTAIRTVFPDLYFGLCHAYAVVGSNVASLVLNRDYRPVAGLAVIDCGDGNLMRLTENDAFAGAIGGAYHCWIESAPPNDPDKELVDIIFKHNEAYAKTQGMSWRHKNSDYLWGPYRELVVADEADLLHRDLPAGRLWLQETPEGANWILRHLADHVSVYVELTALAIRLQRAALQADNRSA